MNFTSKFAFLDKGCQLSLYVTTRKTKATNSRKWQVFSQIWFRQSLDIMVSYYHVQHQKSNDPVLRNPSTDGRTDRQIDKSDFIGRCPTNVERQTLKHGDRTIYILLHIKRIKMEIFKIHNKRI